jgi:hypothetical protein
MPVGTTYSQAEIDPVLAAVCQHWMYKIRHSYDHKKQVFQATANECMQFFNGPRSWSELMGNNFLSVGGLTAESGFPDPDFKVVVNKAFEFVTIFGPTLYYENPKRLARPRMPVVVPPEFFPDPNLYMAVMQQEDQRVRADGLRGVLMETLLDYLPRAFNMAGESRRAIDEALIKGRGCVWTELYQPPGTDIKFVRLQYESTDHLFVDPDARSAQFRDAMWIARRCIQPVWQVERDFGLRRGSLRGNFESMAQQANIMLDENLQFDRKRGYTNDLLVYYKIWSKMGVGGRLSGINQHYRGPLEMFGDYCYLVVAENTRFPLNLSPDVYNSPEFRQDPQMVFDKLSWPIPYWGAEQWPVSMLDFHVIPENPWPMAHLKAAMGELRFLHWAMSWLMGRVRNSCRDFLAIKKSLSEDMKNTILHGEDLALLELEAENPGTIQELIQFLQHPEVNGDVWKLISAVEHNFDKRTGLNDLLYGESGGTQIRSAEEFAGRNSNATVRPDDMAKQVEAWMSEVAKKEAIAARLFLRGDDVAPILGNMGGMLWDSYVASTDMFTACRELEYSVEAGSSRRPNKEFEARTMDSMYQAVAPFLQQVAVQTGDLQPINNLIGDMAKSRALDPQRYIVRTPLPPPMPPAPSGGEGGGPPSEGPPQ